MKKQFKILLFTLIVGSGISCSVAKKDKKAVNRVKADINLLNDAGNSWQQLHPCTIDTVVQFKDGKEIVRYDTLFSQVADTVLDPVTQIKTVYKNVIKYVNKTDTLITYVTDNRALRLSQDEIINQQGQIVQLKADNTTTSRKSANKTWFLVAAVAVILFLSFLLIKKL